MMNNDNQDDSGHSDGAKGGRRAYSAPQVLETAVFETLALACDKTGGYYGSCLYSTPNQS